MSTHKTVDLSIVWAGASHFDAGQAGTVTLVG